MITWLKPSANESLSDYHDRRCSLVYPYQNASSQTRNPGRRVPRATLGCNVALTLNQRSGSFTSRHDCFLWRIVNPACLAHAAVFQTSFDDLIAEQGQHSSPHEQRTRVSVPVDAGSATPIVNRLIGFRA